MLDNLEVSTPEEKLLLSGIETRVIYASGTSDIILATASSEPIAEEFLIWDLKIISSDQAKDFVAKYFVSSSKEMMPGVSHEASGIVSIESIISKIA